MIAGVIATGVSMSGAGFLFAIGLEFAVDPVPSDVLLPESLLLPSSRPYSEDVFTPATCPQFVHDIDRASFVWVGSLSVIPSEAMMSCMDTSGLNSGSPGAKQ